MLYLALYFLFTKTYKIISLNTQIDILENEILKRYPDVLEILLRDQTTKNNILWATNNYEHLGQLYYSEKEITLKLIKGANGDIMVKEERFVM